jgi:uncharacterized protein YbaP (TraB family)
MKLYFIKYAILSFFLLCFVGIVSAQYAPTVASQSLLWRISGKELKAASYIYGTIHIIPKKDFFMGDSVELALLSSERVAFEIDMDDATNIWGQLMLLRRTFMKGDTTLDMLLTKKEYALVQKKMNLNGAASKFLNRVKPMFLSTIAEAQTTPKGATESYEMTFYKMAKDSEKKVEGLETMKYQMSVFDTIPYKVQAKMLVESLKKGKTDENDGMDELVKLYRAQDLVGLGEMFKSDEGLMKYDDIMLNNRNRNWIPVMAKKMKKRTYFFAVGAGHLVGEKGVIALLRKSGYIVEPIYFNIKN